MKTLIFVLLSAVLSLDAWAGRPDPATQRLMLKNYCFVCHQVETRGVGPAYLDVARRYRGDKGALRALVMKVRRGGSGHWGKVPMVAHPNLPTADIEKMVKWVLAQR